MPTPVVNQGSLTLSITLTSGGIAVTTATCNVSLFDPAGAALFTGAAMTHVGSGVYTFPVGPDVLVTPGAHTAVFHSSNAGAFVTSRLEIHVLPTVELGGSAGSVFSVTPT